MKVAIVIRSLVAGGAERQLVVLAKGLVDKGHEVHVISCYDGGAFLTELNVPGVTRTTIHKRGRWDISGAARRLARFLKETTIDVVYSSMPAANLLCVLALWLGARQPLIWRLAASDMDMSEYDWFSALSYRLEAICSNAPNMIVVNSQAGRDAAAARRYPASKLSVVWNGIDTSIFSPDPDAGENLLQRWKLDSSKWRIGMVARADPKKGHGDFLEAVRLLCQRRSDVEFVCVGVDSSDYAHKLQNNACNLGIADKIKWCSFEKDVTAVYNALDINTLPSRFGEGFPNSIGEAMGCGVPCVTTDTGDSAAIVGEVGEVVPRANPEALMRGWVRLLQRLENQGSLLKAQARQRIVENFSVDKYVNQTEELLREVVR